MRTYTTLEVARLAGIGKRTLYRWLYSGAIREPRRGKIVGREYRIWTPADLRRVRQHKQTHYRKGRGRKKR